jgi:DNA polymerase III epsilon subunit-like protein
VNKKGLYNNDAPGPMPNQVYVEVENSLIQSSNTVTLTMKLPLTGPAVLGNRVKILYLDTETTGLDKFKHEIVQLAGIIEIDGEVVEEFDFYMRPEFPVDSASLKAHGYTLDQMDKWPSRDGVCHGFMALLSHYLDPSNPIDRFIAAGHNVRFDLDFLYAFANCSNLWLNTVLAGSIDAISLASILFTFEELIPIKSKRLSFSLPALCEALQIPFVERHNAVDDVRATRQAIRKMMVRIEEIL